MLPNADRAVLDRRKVLEYLLSDNHPVGRHKARVFLALGYTRSDPDRLAADLLGVATAGRVVSLVNTGYGRRYIVDGPVRTPAGAVAHLRTVWIVPHGATAPRFVTAYPVAREGS